MLLVGPLFGSLADYTSYRKLFGAMAMIITILCTFSNVFISEATVGLVLACAMIQVVAYLCVYTMYRAAYLPELAAGEEEVTKLSAKGYVILFISQMFFIGLLITSANIIGGTNIFLYMQSAAAITVILGIILAVIVIKNMGYRLASSKLQAGQNLFTVGFISIYESFKDMAVNYIQLRKFMLFTAFTNPAFNAAPGLAVTIMTAMGLTSNQVSLAIVLVVLVAILGPLLVTFLQRKYKVSIQKLMLGVVTFYMISIILFPLIASISYPFVIIAALSIGLAQGMWLASGQAFFASLCPGGKEATFTGAYMFANKLMDWIPPLVFSILNQATGNLFLSYYCCILLFNIASVVLCYVIDMEKGREEIKDTLKNRRLTLSSDELTEDARDINNNNNNNDNDDANKKKQDEDKTENATEKTDETTTV